MMSSPQKTLFALYARYDTRRSLEGLSYKITLVKLCDHSFPWRYAIDDWVSSCASHISFCLLLLLYTCLSFLTSYSCQTYLDDLSHTSTIEMRYVNFYSVKIKSAENYSVVTKLAVKIIVILSTLLIIFYKHYIVLEIKKLFLK